MVSSLSCPSSRGVRRSASGSSSSSKIGSDTTYFSAAHAPKSINRQRSEQNGKSASVAESVGFLQMGQRCFIVKKLFYHPEGMRTSAEKMRQALLVEILKNARLGRRPLQRQEGGASPSPTKRARGHLSSVRASLKVAVTNAAGLT